jgi:hypothetical protein
LIDTLMFLVVSMVISLQNCGKATANSEGDISLTFHVQADSNCASSAQIVSTVTFTVNERSSGAL